MREFLQEYGFAILAAIVVILLIAMCSPVGNLIKNQVMGVIDSFAGKTESKLAATDAGLPMEVTLTEDGDAQDFKIVAKTDSTSDVITAEYRIKDQYGNWGAWTAVSGTFTSDKAHSVTFAPAGVKNGNMVQVRCKDANKDANTYYESNIVEHTREEA